MQFEIFALQAGGGTLGLSAMPGRFSLLEEDLAMIKAWGAGLVMTMVSTEELEDEGALDLGDRLGELGIIWRHLPISDFGAPGAEVRGLWPGVSTEARAILASGGKVLTHCFGGCGRSGMATLRLMVEVGEAPGAALTRLRQTRPCAVETEAQRMWALEGQR